MIGSEVGGLGWGVGWGTWLYMAARFYSADKNKKTRKSSSVEAAPHHMISSICMSDVQGMRLIWLRGGHYFWVGYGGGRAVHDDDNNDSRGSHKFQGTFCTCRSHVWFLLLSTFLWLCTLSPFLATNHEVLESKPRNIFFRTVHQSRCWSSALPQIFTLFG